jgi:hypothetical protein
MDSALPLSVRRLAPHGGVSSSAACDGVTSSLRASLHRGLTRVPSQGGALDVALQVASSSGGRRMRGLISFFLSGVRPSEELVAGAFGGGRGWSAGGRLVLVVIDVVR